MPPSLTADSIGLTEALLACDAAVEECLRVAALLPGDVSPGERMTEATAALEAAQAADDVVEALMPLVQREKPRGSYEALRDAAARAWARCEACAQRGLRAITPAELRAAGKAAVVAAYASERANDRFGLVCGWVADAMLARAARRKEAA
jgi:hypothetical protein